MTQLKDSIVDEFQYTVDELSFRNRSVLDQMSKMQEATAKLNRAIVKASTQCGCIQIHSKKQMYPVDQEYNLSDVKNFMEEHIEGNLCDGCMEQIDKEMGKTLYYFASLCNTLNFNFYDVILNELDRVRILGKFNLK
ncbi:MAG: DUF1573 domain-containing protein [Epulopiscium sp.]|nr:DUF1573 domain-containing protein [Candidatus Epulonipiscium sp.]